jgi:aspartate carbamoyltransferase catalytic subunit
MSQSIDRSARLQHLLRLDTLSLPQLDALLKRAQHFAEAEAVPSLSGIAVCTLFFEPSTRTRLSFQLAAQRLGAHVLSFDASTSSVTKGEADLDTFRTIQAMGVRGFIIRHKAEGAVAALAEAAEPGVALLNAGDGRSHHPTQGLLDMLTLRQAKGEDFSRLKVLIVGDVKHSRVARSDLHALRMLGCGEIRVCGPAALLPDDDTLHGCVVSHDFDAALEGVDAAMMLRLQRERMVEGLVESLEDYHHHYGLTAARLRRAAPDAIVMHPGPMNRGVEIADDVADGSQSWVLRQVNNGVAVRMAVLETLLG